MHGLIGLLALLGLGLAVLVVVLVTLLVTGARRPPRHTAGYAVARGLPVDPGELGLAFESWVLDRPDGARLPVWEIDTAARGTGNATAPRAAAGLTAVFVHGWGQSRIDMLARLDPWPDLCERIVLYDLRGHGDAESSLSDLGHGEDDDLLDLLARIDGTAVVLVGHSMGAAIGIAAAARGAAGPPPIAGVVAHGPYCDFHRSLRGRLRRSGLPTRPLTDLALAWLALRGIRHAPTDGAAAALGCPLLVIHGTDDPVAPLAEARRIADAAGDAALVEISGASHLDAHEHDPPALDQAIRGFVTRIRER